MERTVQVPLRPLESISSRGDFAYLKLTRQLL